MKTRLYFLESEDVLEIHDNILATEPGLQGVHQDKLEAVVGRVKSIYSYSDEITNAFALAAHYGEAIARGHAFADGNKRTAFVTMVTILKINKIPISDEITEKLTADTGSWTDIMVMVAEGKMTAKQLAEAAATVYMVGLTGIGIAKLVSFFVNK